MANSLQSSGNGPHFRLPSIKSLGFETGPPPDTPGQGADQPAQQPAHVWARPSSAASASSPAVQAQHPTQQLAPAPLPVEQTRQSFEYAHRFGPPPPYNYDGAGVYTAPTRVVHAVAPTMSTKRPRSTSSATRSPQAAYHPQHALNSASTGHYTSIHSSATDPSQHAYATTYPYQSESRPSSAQLSPFPPSQPWAPQQPAQPPSISSRLSPAIALGTGQKSALDVSDKMLSSQELVGRIMQHSQTLYEFATRYASTPHVQPPPNEIDDMAQLALQVVQLVVDLHRTTLGPNEPLPMFSPSPTAPPIAGGPLGVPAMHGDVDLKDDGRTGVVSPMSADSASSRPPKRPWEDSETSVSPSSGRLVQNQEEQDMEEIRKRRLAQLPGGSTPTPAGPASQPKAKYRKRSPGLKRASPPGKCQACYNSETPEWRRGPKGARTLCNACGLHYSKVLKKRTGIPASVNADDELEELRRAHGRSQSVSDAAACTGKSPRKHRTSGASRSIDSTASTSSAGPSLSTKDDVMSDDLRASAQTPTSNIGNITMLPHNPPVAPPPQLSSPEQQRTRPSAHHLSREAQSQTSQHDMHAIHAPPPPPQHHHPTSHHSQQQRMWQHLHPPVPHPGIGPGHVVPTAGASSSGSSLHLHSNAGFVTSTVRGLAQAGVAGGHPPSNIRSSPSLA